MKPTGIKKRTIYSKQMPEWVNDDTARFMVKGDTLTFGKTIILGFRIIGIVFSILFGGVWVFIILSSPGTSLFDLQSIVAIPTILLFLTFSLLLFVECILNPNRDFVFNRLEGTLTMPGSWLMWNGKRITIKYEQVYFFKYSPVRSFTDTVRVCFPGYSQPTNALNMSLWSHAMTITKHRGMGEYDQEISLITWFMDKNRPLPPGIVFDDYREADYLRRKAEGFPPPLYESSIKTPEWEGATTKYNDKNIRKEIL